MYLFDWIVLVLSIALSVTTAGHALFFKRTPQSALGWVAVCLLFPFAGPVMYFFFGINRVRTRAKKLEIKRPPQPVHSGIIPTVENLTFSPSDLDVPRALAGIARLSERVGRLPLMGGNQIQLLQNGEETYPSMIEAIDNAKESLYLSTYIFDTDTTGWRVIDALSRAVKRGVDVHVIIDGVGEFYSSPRASKLLKRYGISHALFLPPRLFPPMLHINLRNHRKMLIADGDIGFTGGMNIGDRHLVKKPPHNIRVADTHFRLMGPVARQLEQIFLEDWSFCTGKILSPTRRPPIESGLAVCRAIADGPNESTDILSTILMGAIASARERVLIMTPYFLPSAEMISVLQTTVLRGIQVEIVLPGVNNLPFVQWAGNNLFWELLYWGVKIYFQPGPFVHTKLFVIDGTYAQIGSANIDSRSLKLNFEMNLEIYDIGVSRFLAAYIDDAISKSSEITIETIDQRSNFVKTRDAITWLFSPYL